MFCTSCGKQVEDGSKFCIHCGFDFSNAQPVTETIKETAPTEAEGIIPEEPIQEAAESTDTFSTEPFTEEAPTDNITETPTDFAPADAPIIDFDSSTDIPEEAPAPAEIPTDIAPAVTPDFDFGSSSDITEEAPSPAETPTDIAPAVTPDFDADNEPLLRNPDASKSGELFSNTEPEVPFENTAPIPPVHPADDGFAFNSQPEPVQEPQLSGTQAEAPVQDTAPAKVGAGRLFGAGLLTFFSILFLITSGILIALKFGATGEILGSRVKELDKNIVLSAEFDGDELSNNIYKMGGIGKVSDWAANKTSFKKYLSQTNILEYAGDKVSSYVDYIISGEGDDPSLTSEDFAQDFFGDNSNNRIAEDEFDYFFDSSALDDIADNLNDSDFDENLSVDKWNDEAGFDLQNIKYAFSYLTIGIIVALALLMFILIIAAVDRRGRYVTGFIGNALYISGVIMLLVGLAVLAGCSVAYVFTGEIAFYVCGNVLMPFAVITLCIAAGELLLGFILKKVKKHIKKKEKAVKNI